MSFVSRWHQLPSMSKTTGVAWSTVWARHCRPNYSEAGNWVAWLVLQGCETYHLAELVTIAVELDQFMNLTRRVLCFKPPNFFLQSSTPPPLRKYLWRIHGISLKMDQIQFKMHQKGLLEVLTEPVWSTPLSEQLSEIEVHSFSYFCQLSLSWKRFRRWK